MVGIPLAIQHAGECALDQLDFAAARHLLVEALVQHRRFGNVHDAATTLGLLGQLALNEQRLDEARAQSEESLRAFRALHDLNCGAHADEIKATVLCAMGETDEALRHAESAVAVYRQLGFSHSLAGSLSIVGCIHAARGDLASARRALRDGITAEQQTDRDTALPGLFEALAAMHSDEIAAAQLLGSAAALRERWHVPVFPSEHADRERRFANVLARHTASDFDLAYTVGRGLSRDAAIQRALALSADVRIL